MNLYFCESSYYSNPRTIQKDLGTCRRHDDINIHVYVEYEDRNMRNGKEIIKKTSNPEADFGYISINSGILTLLSDYFIIDGGTFIELQAGVTNIIIGDGSYEDDKLFGIADMHGGYKDRKKKMWVSGGIFYIMNGTNVKFRNESGDIEHKLESSIFVYF